ncbi:unnamed protein product [Polarella glacialis]|uniref:Uncharacterized protein n=1 Tax=Polarella glacialis TaxID=89957 RepID=A0A813K600_POLGL|nr:unnamed protein product [Polarella glacialis]|mmetsp:Transcript_59679/g.107342  ORF Transcript_59679/g.107342 Transcript_59679/m.107342 type:complete len:240 (+) Transcript_59679:90-809(+)|eukprot:CAMPEP_0115067892 /NCGR_PEP_ID=MMETSP0227-20121206/11657_1 /TAXON_ID=89957 /ORGANISM="Polarella glacialis, Strain CCMP 1383" /LENGTH=239 /DNA_ID=CAMNT_0002454039 /DNA_START=81 /DNA_END=800 /DNA_ORIENTATION=-
MGKGGKGKGGKALIAAAPRNVYNSTLKQNAPWKESSAGSKGGKAEKGGKGKAAKGGKGGKGDKGDKGGKGGGGWVWVAEAEPEKKSFKGGKGKSSGGKSHGKGQDKGKGKGKGKDKGKSLRAAPLSSKFWEKKLGEEGREVLDDNVYNGAIQRYNLKQGWGMILPGNPESLPKNVIQKLEESAAAAEAAGKEVGDRSLLYFRKPDVNHVDGFKLTGDVAVTFKVYTDEKGAGACEVTMA